MININKQEIAEINHGRLPLMEVYYGKNLVWALGGSTSDSCFGAGYWINDKPWLNTDAWKNN